MKKGFIYITTCTINNKKYIGKKYYFYRNGKESNWKDYLGSSKKLINDINLYGKHNFTREIISEHETEEELAIAETQLINNHNAVNDSTYYNLSNSHDKFFTTQESIKKGIETRKKWSFERKQKHKLKMLGRYINRSPEKEAERCKNISKALKNNDKFKKARSETQKKVWASFSEEKKNNINKKKSKSNKRTWCKLDADEKKARANKIKKWHKKLSVEEKRKWVDNIKAGKKQKMYVFYNIKENFTFTGNVVDFGNKYKIDTSIANRLANKKYSKNNIYKKTWKVIETNSSQISS